MKENYFTNRAVGIGLTLLTALTLSVIPITTYAATTTTTISSAISSTIGVLTSNGTVNINTTPTAGGVQTTSSDTVTVSTNNSGGYTLKIGETTASSALVGPDSIPATSGTQAAPTALTTNTWGYRVDGVGGFGAGPTTGISNAPIGTVQYAAVPATASPNTLKNTSTTASNDTTTVWYSVALNTAKPSGTYTNSVTYTATTN